MAGNRIKKRKKPDWIIDNWRKGLKFFSIQSMVASQAVMYAWGTLPANLTNGLSTEFRDMLVKGLLFLGTIGVFIKQEKK